VADTAPRAVSFAEPHFASGGWTVYDEGPCQLALTPYPATALLEQTHPLTTPTDPVRILMKTRRVSITVVMITTCLFAVALGLRTGDPPATQMQTYASAWIETLDDGQKKKALLAFEDPERINWNFIPLPTRKGLPLMEMSLPQQTAALRALKAALSEAGYEKSSKIMLLEGVLRQFEGADSHERRNPEKYYVTIYGTPSATDQWGFSFEGHHLSLNFVCRDGKVVASTPQFMATNPAIIMSDVKGPLGKGTQVLRQEEEIAFELINKLSPDLKKRAIIDEKAPADIRFVGKPQMELSEPEGLVMSDMDEAAQKRLMQLIEVYANVVPEKLATERMEEIRSAGPSSIHFAWAGATERNIGHYYRISGKSFVIELVNTQPDAEGTPANHIHAVWRDTKGDFGLPIK